ncbi:MAG: hypothetical protein KAK01_04310, partial [Candidatus Marinimicrobia bacterium]|nr:hypothetical protein [Candidatus Neomarinimicrobiota bacterium]
MDFTNLNIYQRLRDFDVPAAVLDAIFDSKDDLKVLQTSWQEMSANGLRDDEVARTIAHLIFKEIDISLDLD